MVFDLIPIIIILISLAVCVFLIVRRFPQMASVDVDQIPEEQQADLKKQILEKQFEKKFKKMLTKVSDFASPVTKIVIEKFDIIKNKIIKKKQVLEKESIEFKEKDKSQNEILHELLEEGANLIGKEDYIEAEKVFIKALEIDKHESIIYKNLGDIYIEQKKYEYAIETFKYLVVLENKKIKKAANDGNIDEEHLLKRDLAQTYFELAKAYKVTDNIKETKRVLEKALLIDFKNPRYLDFLCEVCIILKDKLGAQSCISRLREVNIDNNKIEVWQEEIDQL